ncbi:hypothetical protein [Parendozoicomonas haliclonae]|uniref:TubC N-terminal docking domain-containing protein n=1 Tax=Parendozoicomonas haliclonae TaxID=1960125 RepID=A0A1X7AIP6_9GAMM|nr:hypothetical protein [Parendozoicomonas haliclonae]SMA45531.1 hypothetical protein EHSB41UT_01942 [Parendozoicomonas haliclonae]
MSPLQLLTWLEIHGVSVNLVGSQKLVFHGPKSLLTDQVMAHLKKDKPFLLKALAGQQGTSTVGEAFRFLCEGLSISITVLLCDYLTEDDLLDIRKGVYPDLTALRQLIQKDLTGRDRS